MGKLAAGYSPLLDTAKGIGQNQNRPTYEINKMRTHTHATHQTFHRQPDLLKYSIPPKIHNVTFSFAHLIYLSFLFLSL